MKNLFIGICKNVKTQQPGNVLFKEIFLIWYLEALNSSYGTSKTVFAQVNN